MILSAVPAGEYDKRVVILTTERGKISAFARGARRPNSPLAGVTSPFTFGEITLYEGRTSYTMVQAEISNYFTELRADMEAVYYGCYFLEFADFYTRENNDEKEMLKLLYQSLRALTNRKIPRELVRYIFELKAVSVSGEAPEVFACVECGSAENLTAFDSGRGGCLCGSCFPGARHAACLSPSTLYTLQYIVSSPVEKLYTFTVSEQVQKELRETAADYLKVYVNRKFKSLEVLESCLGHL